MGGLVFHSLLHGPIPGSGTQAPIRARARVRLQERRHVLVHDTLPCSKGNATIVRGQGLRPASTSALRLGLR